MPITVRWDDEKRFEVETETGVRVALDGDGEAGPSPMEVLLASLAGCMAIDVVDILRKGREELTGCAVRAEGERREDPPRRYTGIRLVFELEGRGLSRRKAERAVELSRETYCSVSATLAPDLDVSVKIEIAEVEPAG